MELCPSLFNYGILGKDSCYLQLYTKGWTQTVLVKISG